MPKPGCAVSHPPPLAMMAAMTHDCYAPSPHAVGRLADACSPNDFFLAFSPERKNPGNVEFFTRTIPKLVGGVDAGSTQVATALYAAAGCHDDADEAPTPSPRRRHPA